jgi:putative DNA primase/helicase
VTYGLVIGEGIETVLAAAARIQYCGTLLRPAWAAGSKDNLAGFPVLNIIERLTVLVDHDANSEGQKAAAQCIRRWRQAGREANGLIPKQVDSDFNDLIRRHAS